MPDSAGVRNPQTAPIAVNFSWLTPPAHDPYDAKMTRTALVICLALTTPAWTAWAQQATPQRPATLPRPTARSGNPTPGTPQPDPPNVDDRITVTGCLQLAPGTGAPPASAATVPVSTRYLLKNARKDGSVPPETGTSIAAAVTSASTFRLEALESHLSPFVNTRVELSGEVKASGETTPILLVEYLRKIAAKCQ